MANFEDKIRQKFGIPIEQGAQAAGQSVDDMYAKLLALQAMRRAAMPPQLPHQPVDTTSSSGGMSMYDKQLSDEDKRRQAEAQNQVNAINNAEAPIDESQYKQYAYGGTATGGADGLMENEENDTNSEQNPFIDARMHEFNDTDIRKSKPKEKPLNPNKYAEGGIVNGFPQLQGMMQPSYGKATAELDASRDPMDFIRKSKNMSIKGKKGIAF